MARTGPRPTHTERVTFHLSPVLVEQLQELSVREERNLSELMREALALLIEKHKP